MRRIIVSMAFISIFFISHAASARIELIKSSVSDAVYYLDTKNTRHVFPDRQTFDSWYDGDFSGVTMMSGDYIASLDLGDNIVMRPGNLVKISSAPLVYAVEPGGVLRMIADESVASSLFGSKWMQQVKDIPEAFWQNYSLGEPIKYAHNLPNGITYQLSGEEKLYYLWRGALVPLKGSRALTENRLDPERAVMSEQVVFSRERPVSLLDQKIFDPSYELFGSSEDCGNTALHVGVLLVTNGNPSDETMVRARWIHQNLSELWSGATQDLSSLQTPAPLVVVQKDAYLWTRVGDKDRISLNEAAFSYFDQYPDTIDFLIVLNDFYSLPDRHGEYVPVTNRVTGNRQITLRAGFQFGSQGKLKGVIHLGNVNDHSFQRGGGLNGTANLLLHELGHAWSGRAVFVDDTGHEQTSLLRSDLVHWSDYVNFTSPLGGFGWRPLGNGTYLNRAIELSEEYVKSFSPLDLYLMGLYPAPAVGSVTYLVPSVIDKVNNTVVAEERNISIDQIVTAMGKMKCEAEG